MVTQPPRPGDPNQAKVYAMAQELERLRADRATILTALSQVQAEGGLMALRKPHRDLLKAALAQAGPRSRGLPRTGPCAKACDACASGRPSGGNVDLCCLTCGHRSCEVGA